LVTDVRSDGLEDQRLFELRQAAAQRRALAGDVVGGSRSLADALTASSDKGDGYNRARTPYSTGFIFTVRPNAQAPEKASKVDRAAASGGKALLTKKMHELQAEGACGNHSSCMCLCT
jgi:hypothetical protein